MKPKLQIITLTLVLLLASCQKAEPDVPRPEKTVVIEKTEAIAEPIITPEQEFNPRFEEEPCPFTVPENHIEGETVKCGFVIVPEDHYGFDGRTIKLAVAIFKAQAKNPQPDPMIFLSGGPGEKTVVHVAPLAEHLSTFNRERDIIFFDQRGVGSSEPALECPEFVEALFDILDEADPEASQRTVYNAIMACKDRLVNHGHNLAAYTTSQNAADVEAIRVALGYEGINLFGGSYGSLLAQAVMQYYPEHIRSVVIDSTVPMEKSLLIDIPTTAVKAALHLMETCAEDTACNTAYPDLQNLLFETVDALNEEPIPVTLVNPLDGANYEALLTGEMIFGNLVFFLYQTPIIPTLPKAINDVANGDYDLMIQLSNRKLAAYDAMSRGMTFSVLCTDDLVGRTPEDYLDLRTALPSSLAGRSDPEDIIKYGAFGICQQWPVEEANPSVKEPVISDIPTLVLGGEYDPVTPPEYGRMVADHLSNSYFFEFPSIGHSVAVANECARVITTDFITDPTTEPDSTCLGELAIEFVLPIDFNNIPLVPVTIPEFGIKAVIPEGWTQVSPEYFVSPDTTIELVIKEKTDSGLGEFLEKWGATDVIAEIERNDLKWTLYESKLEEHQIAGYIAIAPSEDGFFLVLIVTTPTQQALLLDSVFTPIIDVFSYDEALIASDKTPQSDDKPGISVHLIPFEDTTFNFRGLVPEGWSQAQQGIRVRGSSTKDQTLLIQKSYDGMTEDTLLDILLPSLQLEGLPPISDERETPGLTWTIYQTSISALGVGTFTIDMALCVDDEIPYLVLLQTEASERENTSIFEDIFLPVVDALEPLR
jgi:pimeloyl-ACP methyl ester carboxylesterase